MTDMPATERDHRSAILGLVRDYHGVRFPSSAFVPGESPVPVSGRVFDGDEVASLVDSALDFWLTSGRFAAEFEKAFGAFMQARHVVLCNSGSSANLLAVAALTSKRLQERRLQPGDEVLTVAAGFPTTVNPLLQHGLVPVFVDVELETYNVDVAALEAAVGPRTRAVMMAHTLGNPFDLDAVTALARKHDLWLVEDTCDAVGSLYRGRPVGSFGDLATVSFYPAHHLTMGEGGAVLTGRQSLRKLVESYRDWGRDCWCEPGNDNTCGRRFDWQLGELPYGYDHKYVYSHIGYNLKLTDMQAAVGVAQMGKLPHFVEARRRNWQRLRDALAHEEWLLLPSATPHSEPSWFGFAIGVRPEAPFSRTDLVRHLESKRIGTRQLFAGNLVRQPAYEDAAFRVAGELDNADFVMDNVFWVGVYPGLTDEMLDFVAETIKDFTNGSARGVGASTAKQGRA